MLQRRLSLKRSILRAPGALAHATAVYRATYPVDGGRKVIELYLYPAAQPHAPFWAAARVAFDSVEAAEAWLERKEAQGGRGGCAARRIQSFISNRPIHTHRRM
jgi:hypothetical protein